MTGAGVTRGDHGRYAPPVGVVYCGIDEAGYGPMLGPLCVGMAAFRVRDWSAGDPAPDLWAMLGDAVCTSVRAAKSGAIAVADSKALKGANSLKTRHPLLHLERGVLAFERAAGHEITDDAGLLAALGARHEGVAWQGGDPIAMPMGTAAAELAIATNVLIKALHKAGVEVLALRCRVIGVAEFNAELGRSRSKATTTEIGLREHLGLIRERWGGETVRVVCDRQSGRADYSGLMARAWAGERVEELERSARVSRYSCGDAGFQFVPGAEDAHFPVALASMVAKLVRELAMARFNRYWGGRVAELKPTAGYVEDARRWLHETRDAVSADERRALVRKA